MLTELERFVLNLDPRIDWRYTREDAELGGSRATTCMMRENLGNAKTDVCAQGDHRNVIAGRAWAAERGPCNGFINGGMYDNNESYCYRCTMAISLHPETEDVDCTMACGCSEYHMADCHLVTDRFSSYNPYEYEEEWL